jgi:excisionase family DNA binding protein
VLKDDIIVGAKAAGAHCGLSPRFIYSMVERGELPVIRSGKRLLFRKSEIERALSSEAA